MASIQGLRCRGPVLVVLAGMVVSMLGALPASASWDAPPGRLASGVAPTVPAGVESVSPHALAAAGGDPRGGADPRPDDGVTFDAAGLVPVPRVIGSTSKRAVPVSDKHTPVRELTERRTASEEWWLNDDGTVTKYTFTQPKFFDVGGGKFAPIDTTVAADVSRAGWFSSTAGALKFSFGPIGAGGDGGVEVASPGRDPIRFWPSFAKPAKSGSVLPTVGTGKDANTVTYGDVAPGVDLVYSVTASGLSERIVLRAPSKIADWSFEVEGAQLQSLKDGNGKDTPNVFESADPADRFVLPGAQVIDRNGEPREGANKQTVQRSDVLADRAPRHAGAKATRVSKVTVSIDAAWLAGLKDTDFPVIIDPTVADSSSYRMAFNDQGWTPGVNAYSESFAGRNPAGTAWRSFAQYTNFKDPYSTTTEIADAHLELTSSLGWEFDQTSPVEAHAPNSPNYWDWTYTSFDPTVISSTQLSDHAVLDVTSLVRSWLSNGWSYGAVAFKGDESQSNTKKAFFATLVTTYDTHLPPAGISHPTPPDNGVTELDNPTLTVEPVVDPRGATVTYQYEVSTVPDFSSIAITSGWLSAPSYTVAYGALDSATTWYWRVKTNDQWGSVTTPTSGFTLRRTAFGYNGFSGYFKGLNTLGGNYVFTETDAQLPSTGFALDLTRTFNTENSKVGVFGKGWSTPYFMSWETSGANIVVTYPDGRRETHTSNGSGGWTPPAGYVAQLSGTTSGGFTLTQGDHTVQAFAAGSTSGSLTQITDPAGHVLSIDVSQLASNKKIVITDVVSGRAITVTTSVATVPFLVTKAEIANPAGGTFAWTYTYDTTTPSVPKLTSACDARGTVGFCKTYSWDTSNRLWKVFDRKGQLDVQFGYSSFGGRVTSLTDAAGNVTTFTYGQSTTAPYDITVQMTDARSNVWRQDYSNIGQFIREYVPGVTNPWVYAYDPLTRMRTKSTDPNGNSSTIAYTADLRDAVETSGVGVKTYKVHDDAGNVVKVCDGRSVDVNNDRLPDADTFCTLFDYGPSTAERTKGLVRSQNRFGLAAETFTYTGSNDTLVYGSTTQYVPAGLLKTDTDPAGKTTSYEYTVAGDVARVSDNTGPGTGGAPTSYEAENAASNYTFDNSTSTSPAFSGTGFEKYGNWSGSSIVWTVNAATAGTYTMTVRSTSGYGGTTNRQMSINGAASSQVTFPATAWTVWADATYTVNLVAGSNTIGFSYDASTGSADAYFDYITIAGTGGVGKDVRYTYDSIGRRSTQTEYSDTFPSGVTTSYTYNAVNDVVSVTAASVTNPVTGVAHQQRATRTYDANRNVTDAVASDVTGGDTSQATHVDYDTMDRPIQVTDPEANITQSRYDVVGNVVHVRDGEGRWVRTTFNNRNLPIQSDELGVVANPDVASSVLTLTQVEYDAGGRKTATVDARTQRVEYAYDAGDRPMMTIMRNYRDDVPAGAVRDVLLSRVDSYDSANHALSVSEGGTPSGTALRVTTFGYDNAGRKVTTGVSSAGMLTTVTYDAMSRPVQVDTTRSGVAAGGVSTAQTRTIYDRAGRTVTSTVENGATDITATVAYDSRGVAKTSTDANANVTTVTSDALGRPVNATAPSVSVESNGGAATVTSPVSTVGFNTFGNQTQMRDPRGNVTTTVFDRLGRVGSITYPSYTSVAGGAAIVAVESFAYDHVGNQTGHTDRRGYSTNYAFDVFNRPVTQTDPSISGGARGVWTNTYDNNGNLTASTDPTGAQKTATYDAMNRVRSQTDVVRALTVNAVTVPGGSYTTLVTHDDLGRVVQSTSAQGVVKSVTVDALGEATGVKDTAATTIASGTYDVYGHVVTADDALGRETRTAYDQAGRSLTVGAYENSSASTAITAKTAGYDANSNVTAVTDGNGYTTTAAFDSLNRMTAVTTPVSASKTISTSYGYDAANNLTRVRDGRASAPSPFYTDAYTGSNGAAWSTLRWNTSVSASSVVDIQSNSGHLQVPATSNGWARATDDTTSPRNAGSTMQDADVTASVKTGATIGGGLTARLWARGTGVWNTTNAYLQTAGYAVVLNEAAGTVAVTKMTTASNTETSLGSASFSYAANTTYKVRLETVGSTIRAKIWNATGSEPSSWTVSGTDSANTSGVVAVSINTGTNSAARDTYIDDVAVTPATTGTVLSAYDTVTTYNSWNAAETVIEAATGTQTTALQRTFTRVYDAGGLPVKDIAPDGTATGIAVTNTFDELGRMTAQAATGLSKTFGYDLAGRETSVSLPVGSQTLTFDDRSLLVGASGNAGNLVAKFNGDGQLTWRQDPSGLANYHYNNLGLADQVGDASTGTTLNTTFNAAYQPTRVDDGTPGATTPYHTYTYDAAGRKTNDTVTVGASTKYNATVAYDAASNVTSETVKNLYGVTATDETYTYSYDRSNRLITDTRQIGTGAVATTNTTFDDAGNRLTSGSKTWTYDQRGRIASSSVDGNYTWDPRGTLAKTVNASNLAVTYSFDLMGRMAGYNGNGNNVTYRYDALDRIYDRTNTTTAQTTAFAYSGVSTKIASSVTSGTTKSYSRDQNGQLVGVKSGATARLAGLNNHTDVRYLYDTTGTVTDTKTFDPTGNVINSTGSTGSELGYQSEYTDPASNQVWMAARWYNPASATFQSRDTNSGSTANPISLNRYTYTNSGYLNGTDPTGHQICIDVGAGIMACSEGFDASQCPAGQRKSVFGVCYDPYQHCADQGTVYDERINDCLTRDGFCTRQGLILSPFDGTCFKPWATGDPCGTNGIRGLDVNICIVRQTPGSACNWNGVDGSINGDGTTCDPLPATPTDTPPTTGSTTGDPGQTQGGTTGAGTPGGSTDDGGAAGGVGSTSKAPTLPPYHPPLLVGDQLTCDGNYELRNSGASGKWACVLPTDTELASRSRCANTWNVFYCFSNSVDKFKHATTAEVQETIVVVEIASLVWYLTQDPNAVDHADLDKIGTAADKSDLYHQGVDWALRSSPERFEQVYGGKPQTLFQVLGSINGRDGVFEWITEKVDGQLVISHQVFKAGETITGHAN